MNGYSSPAPTPASEGVVPAGLALDAAIAEKVMGIAPMDVRVRGEVDTPPVRIWNASPYWRQDGRHDRYQLTMNADAPPYSTDIAAAWLVVEHLQKALGLSFALSLNACAGGHQNGAKFYEGYRGLGHDIFDNAEHEGWYAVDETVPLAICKAALAAVRRVGTLPLAADEGR